MHHSDIEAPVGWLDTLLEELDRHRADVISAVVAIKDYRGLTSTGYREPDLGPITRLTVKEVNRLPETNSIEDLDKPGRVLMVNTGLWVCRFTVRWVENACFNVCDAISHVDGVFSPKALPEDWNFSGFCALQGLKVVATRKVKAVHHGNCGYPNNGTWGEWDTDKGD